MAVQENYFIVDGVFHADVPTAFSQLTEDNFGVADTVYKVADGRRIVTVQSPQNLDYGDYRDYFHRRKILVQAWKAEWGEESLMSNFMAEQLRELYETQKPFWIQYDDEMSRCWGRLIGLNADLNDGNAPHAYFTPHYPIFPYGHEPPDDPEAAGAWDGMLWVANSLWDGDFSVYPDYGLVLLPADSKRFNDRIKAHLKYTWRAYVRVRSLALNPFQIAQTYYTGMVEFEQIAVPITGVALEWRDPPYTGICTYYARDRIRTFERIAIVAKANGYAYGAVDADPITPVSPIRIRSFVRGLSTTPVKYAQTPVGQIKIIVPVGGGGGSIQSTKELGSVVIAIASTGTGWLPNVTTKTVTAVVSDADASTYAYGSTFSQKFLLAPMEDPNSSTGHTITIDWRRLSGNTTKLTVYLLQGERTITQVQFTRSSDGNSIDTYTLTGAEADSITDYTNLWIRLYADYQAGVVYFNFALPGATIKYASPVGTIAVTATAKGTKPLSQAYPVLAQVKVLGTGLATKSVPDIPGGDA